MNNAAEKMVTIRKGSALGVLTRSVQEDFDYINANLREMDQFEHDHFVECGEADGLDGLEKSWTLHLYGEIVGYVALAIPPMESPLVPIRFVPMLSTKNVDKHPIDYARLSRSVLEYVITHAPSWVTEFYTVPLAKYRKSVKWQELMGWHIVREFDLNGETAVLMHLSRKEI